MDAIDRDPMTAEVDCQRFCHVHQAGLRAPPLRLPALRALPPLMLMMRPQPAFFMNGMTARDSAARHILHVEILDQISSMTVSIGPVAVAEPLARTRY